MSEERRIEDKSHFVMGALPGNGGHAPMRNGAGVLLHADGTVFTAEQIAAMERRDLADDEEESSAEIADEVIRQIDEDEQREEG